MKNTYGLLLLCAVSLYATNGTNLIGTSTASRSLGGTGVAHYTYAAEAMHRNIALINDVNQSEFRFDITYFKANVTSTVYDKMPLNANLSPLPNLPSYDEPTSARSQSMPETNYIPSMSYVMRVDPQTVFGFAMIGAAGMAVNYEKEYAQRQLKSSMMLMKILPAISYRQGNTTFAFAPVLGLGSLSLNYDEAYLDPEGTPYPYGTKPQSTRSGLFGTDVGGERLEAAFGYEVGFDVQVTPKFRVGASYKSSLRYTYKEVANFAQFGPSGMVYMADEWMWNNAGVGLSSTQSISQQLLNNGFLNSQNETIRQSTAELIEYLAGTTTIQEALAATDPTKRNDLTLEQPLEIAIGFSYDVTEISTFTFDYRYIAWGLAKGYKDFGWKNQNVLAAGLDFHLKKFNFRLGYNYADSPIENVSDELGSLLSDMQGTLVFDQALSMLNMVGFPAISTTHFTCGAGFRLSDTTDLDLAFVYSPESTVAREGTLNPIDLYLDALNMTYEYETTMEQISFSLGLNTRF